MRMPKPHLLALLSLVAVVTSACGGAASSADNDSASSDTSAPVEMQKVSVGNFGNTPVGILRHPTWHEWDLTLSRRFPINLMGRKTSGVRLRYEVYNVFNEVQFTNLNAAFTFTGPNNSQINSANTGKYTASGDTLAAGTITPRVMALTLRFDW